MVRLSFSSLSILYDCPHNWLNKQMEIPQEEQIYFKEGKICHRIIQDHVARIKTHNSLKHILHKFPIVERVDYDPRCKFEIEVGGCKIIGYYDGLNWPLRKYMEVKSSSTLWTLGKYQRSIQRKIYALGSPVLEEGILITCSRNPADWKNQPPKVLKVPLTKGDREQATEYILGGIEILKAGNFLSDLEIIDGKPTCTDFRCYWGKNCRFK